MLCALSLAATVVRAQTTVPDWQLSARVEMRPLSRGECTSVSLLVRNAQGRVITRPDGNAVGPADFEVELGGPGAASFKWERNTPDNYRVCATVADGPDRADIIITYPRRMLPDDAVYPGVAFTAQLPVYRGDGGGTPESSRLGLRDASGTVVVGPVAPPPSDQVRVPDWQARGRVETRPLAPGACAFVAFDVRDARGRSIIRPDGNTIGPGDFEVALSGPGAASFKWERNTPNNYKVCATFAPGPDRADVVIRYPRQPLPDYEIHPGVAFTATLPVVRGTTGGATPEFTALPLSGAAGAGAAATGTIPTPPASAGAAPASTRPALPPISTVEQPATRARMLTGDVVLPLLPAPRPAIVPRAAQQPTLAAPAPSGSPQACRIPELNEQRGAATQLSTLFARAAYCSVPGNPGAPPTDAAKDTRTASAWGACCTRPDTPSSAYNDYLAGVVSGLYSGQFVQQAMHAVWRNTFDRPCGTMYPTAEARLAAFAQNGARTGDVVTDVTPPTDSYALPPAAQGFPLGVGCRWQLVRTGGAFPADIQLVGYTNAVSFLYTPILDPPTVMLALHSRSGTIPDEPIADLGLEAYFTARSGAMCSGVIVVRTSTSVLLISVVACREGAATPNTSGPRPELDRNYLERVARDIVARYQPPH